MNMYLSILFSFISLSAFASQRIDYANIYADTLIEQFDKEVENSLPGDMSFLTSATYLKLIAVREFIEHSGEKATPVKNGSLLFARDADLYADIQNVVNSDAERLSLVRKRTNRRNNNNVLYPSATGAGNITGNTFPRKVWSLTFDDGPHATRTTKIVDLLIENGMQATFFVLAKKTKKLLRAVDYVLSNGMELALHSYNHLDLSKQSAAKIEYEVLQAKKDIEAEFRTPLTLFRLPYGAGMRKSSLRKQIADYKLIHVFWNVDTLDWKDKNPKSIFKRTVAQMKRTPKNSGVILFHDIHAQTVKASEMVMKYLNDNAYQVCTVGEMVKYHNGETQYCLN